MFELLKQYCDIPGPGGDEHLVQDFVSQRWQGRVKTQRRTGVGNVIAEVGGKGPSLVLAAHADELCYAVRHIGEDGFIWLGSGQRDAERKLSLRGSVLIPWGQPALILTRSGTVEGIFATLTGHVLSPEQVEKTSFDWNDVFVDIGCSSRQEVIAKGVSVGDRIIWNPPLRQMGKFVYGKALDDRIGLLMLDHLLDILEEDKLAFQLVFASTVQEEIGLVGAESLADETGCQMGIALDIGLAGDVPGVDQRNVSAALGMGPTIVHKDLSLYHRGLTLALMDTAEKMNIPVQPAVFSLYGTDASAMTRHGLQTAALAVPTRYTHSPFEMLHLDDVEAGIKLLAGFLTDQEMADRFA